MASSVVPMSRVPRWWWPAALLALLIALYSLRYALLGERAYVPELAASFRERPLTLAIHTLFGPLALLTGLVNLLPAMRRRARWAAHRWIGRVYLVSALMLGGAGFVLALRAAGGPVSRTGFLILAIATLGSAIAGYVSIRRGDARAHREWMFRSYALIFGAVTLRLWMPLLIVVYGGEFLPAYRWVAWVSWVPNLAWAEWVIRRGWHPRHELPPALAGDDARRRRMPGVTG